MSPPLPVEVEVAGAVPPDAHAALAAEVADRVRSKLNFTPDIRLIPEATLPRTSLKTRYIHRAYDQSGS